MSQDLAIRTDKLPQLLSEIIQLQDQVATASLGNLTFVREADGFLQSIISLEEFSLPARAFYAYTDQQANAHDIETIMEMMDKIQKEALKVRIVLRQAALQVVVNPVKMTEYQSRLRILMESLCISLASLIKTSKDWAELPPFSFLNSLSENREPDH
jgi:cell fate (sporulation/competence/biofilm development) regulator YmcA (YheA/YmcA/DUF963 family)